MKIYFNAIGQEVKRETDDIWVQGNDRVNVIQAFFEDLDLTGLSATIVQLRNGDTKPTPELVMTNANSYLTFTLSAWSLAIAGPSSFTIRLKKAIGNDNFEIKCTALFTREVTKGNMPSDSMLTTPEASALAEAIREEAAIRYAADQQIIDMVYLQIDQEQSIREARDEDIEAQIGKIINGQIIVSRSNFANFASNAAKDNEDNVIHETYATKAEVNPIKQLALQSVKNIDFQYNQSTGVATIYFTLNNGERLDTSVNFPINSIILHVYYDTATEELVLVFTNGEEVRIPVAGMFTAYVGGDTEYGVIKIENQIISIAKNRFSEESGFAEEAGHAVTSTFAEIASKYANLTDGSSNVWMLNNGIPIIASSSNRVNIHSITDYGNYYCVVGANYIDNLPFTGLDFIMKVYNPVGDANNYPRYIVQEVYKYNTSDAWMHHSFDNGSSWTAWHQFRNNEGYLALDGGTIRGNVFPNESGRYFGDVNRRWLGYFSGLNILGHSNTFQLSGGTEIGSETIQYDLNQIIEVGSYYMPATSWINNILHKPDELNVAFTMKIVATTGPEWTGYRSQEIYSFASINAWVRHTEDRGETWTEWVKIRSEDGFVETKNGIAEKLNVNKLLPLSSASQIGEATNYWDRIFANIINAGLMYAVNILPHPEASAWLSTPWIGAPNTEQWERIYSKAFYENNKKLTDKYIQFTTTAPTAPLTEGLGIAILSATPTNRYNGWLYIITG